MVTYTASLRTPPTWNSERLQLNGMMPSLAFFVFTAESLNGISVRSTNTSSTLPWFNVHSHHQTIQETVFL
jgi:hypothetical protein